MSVRRLRTQRDQQLTLGLDQLRADIQAAAGNVDTGLVQKLVTLVDRAQAARSGWRFTMVDADRYRDVLRWLATHSKRPQAATLILAELFTRLPDDANEVELESQAELAEAVEMPASVVSEALADLERVGAIYRKKVGRKNRLFVNPRLGTHLGGATRDRAQLEAPELKQPAERVKRPKRETPERVIAALGLRAVSSD